MKYLKPLLAPWTGAYPGGGVFLHDEVNSANLVHELHAIGKQHPVSGADFVFLEELLPRIASCLGFQADGFENVALFLENLWMIRFFVVDVTEYLESLCVLPVVVEVSRGLWKPKDDKDDNLKYKLYWGG